MRSVVFALAIVVSAVGGDIPLDAIKLACGNPESSAVVRDRSATASCLIEHAIRTSAQVQEYAAEIESFGAQERDDNTSSVRTSGRIQTVAFRAPALFWSRAESSRGPSNELIAFSDGKDRYEFSAARPASIAQLSVDSLDGRRIDTNHGIVPPPLSPTADQARTLARLNQQAERSAYLGRQLMHGVLCHVVELSLPIDSKLRKHNQANAGVSDNGYELHRFYLGDDGLMRRHESSVEKHGGSTQWNETNYRVRQLELADQFTLNRFMSAVRAALQRDELPPIVRTHNRIGESLPAIAATLWGGGKLRWSDYYDKILVVQTWASWCGNCKQAMPFYEAMRQKLSAEGVVFVALNFEPSLVEYEAWVRKNLQKYGFVFARADVTEADWNQKLQDFKGNLPAFYVVDRDGRIVAGYSGFGYGAGNEDPRLVAALQKAGLKVSHSPMSAPHQD